MIKIKDFSENTGFSIRMLRYLEEVSVLVPRREENNYRVYSEGQIEVARKIKKLQMLGVQLKEVEILQSQPKDIQIEVLEGVLKREIEISQIKSETIPELKIIIDALRNSEEGLYDFLGKENQPPKKMRSLGGEEKFQRTAFSIPILRTIYEEHVTIESHVELIATDLMKFGEWFKENLSVYDVYSVLRESSFVLGRNLTDDFLKGYELAWRKFLPQMGFQKMDDFTRDDIGQIMGLHDIIIRTTFKYKDSLEEGEIIIPYSPIYTMSQLSART